MYKNNFVVLDIRLVQLCHTAQQQQKRTMNVLAMNNKVNSPQ